MRKYLKLAPKKSKIIDKSHLEDPQSAGSSTKNKTRENQGPYISIGMPVFNGEKYLEDALKYILNQSYTNFELIISDNASTDNTSRICNTYALKDKRIRYYRNEKNLGITMNFNKVFKLSSGEYFKWAAYDDVLDQDYLLKCVKILQRDPSIVLCHSKTVIINEENFTVGSYDLNRKLDSQKPHERFGNIIIEGVPFWILIWGLIRSSSLRSTSLIGNYIGADRNLLAELSLIGRIHVIPKYLFYRRSHEDAYTEKKVFLNPKETLKWWTKDVRMNFPFVKIIIEYIRSVKGSTLKWSDKFLCYMQIFFEFFRDGLIKIIIDVTLNILYLSAFGVKIMWYTRMWLIRHKYACEILKSKGINI